MVYESAKRDEHERTTSISNLTEGQISSESSLPPTSGASVVSEDAVAEKPQPANLSAPEIHKQTPTRQRRNAIVGGKGQPLVDVSSPLIAPFGGVGELGNDLESLREKGELDYDFDRKNDKRNPVSRFLVNKFSGAANYIRKHPVKAFSKTVIPGAGVVMNLAGSVKSAMRSKKAGADKEESKTEAERLMYSAYQKKNKKEAIKKGVGAVVGAATIGAGGGFDFGASEGAGELASQGIEALGGAVSGLIENNASLVGSEALEQLAEDPIAELGEDSIGHLSSVIGNKRSTDSKTKSLISTSRKARLELGKTDGDKSLAHRSLLGKDTKYGDSVRKAVRSTLLDKEGPMHFEKQIKTGPQELIPSRESITAKQNMLGQLKEVANKQPKAQSEDGNLDVEKVVQDVPDTIAARNQRLQDAMGYTKTSDVIGRTSDGRGIQRKKPISVVEADTKETELKEKFGKSWYEA